MYEEVSLSCVADRIVGSAAFSRFCLISVCRLSALAGMCTPLGEQGLLFFNVTKMLINYTTNKQKIRLSPVATNTRLPLSLSFPLPLSLSSVVEDGGLSVGDGMVRDGRRCFGGIGGGGS